MFRMSRACLVATLATLLISLAAPVVWAAPDSLDPSFGQGGYAVFQVNKACLRRCIELAGSYADALALQPNGRIVLGGYNNYIGAGAGFEWAPGALIRLLPNGALDTSFGAGGLDDTPFEVWKIYTDARGRLLAIGAIGGRTVVRRYTPDGVLDSFYGSGGMQWLSRLEGKQPEDEQRDGDGRFVAFTTVTVPATDYDPSRTRLDLTRRLPSGEPDPGFGHQGYARLPDSLEASPVTLATQDDGSVIAAFDRSSQTSPPETTQLTLERLSPTGKLDRTFGERGVLRVPFREGALKMVVAPNGHILLALGERRGALFGSTDELVLADYMRAGRLDRSFGNGGIARSQLPTGPRYRSAIPTAITFDGSGDTIVVGEHSILTTDVPAGDGFLARYTPHGRDCSFGEGGVLVDERFGGAKAVAVQRDGRIVVAGWGGGFRAARYMGGGAPHTCPGEPVRLR